MKENDIGTIIVNSAIEIHRKLGPGLLETVYEQVLMHELGKKGLSVQSQVPVPLNYDGIKFKIGFRADMIVENKVILELKSIETLSSAHKKQLLTYLKLTKLKLGYILNFGEEVMRSGIVRIINGELK